MRIATAETAKPAKPPADTTRGSPERCFVAINLSLNELRLPCRTATTRTLPPARTNTRVKRRDITTAEGMNTAIASSGLTPG
jgi:hypothetical protein